MIVESSPYLHGVVDADFTFRYVSPGVVEVLGYRPEELVGTSALTIVHPEDLELGMQAFVQVLDRIGDEPEGSIPLALRLIGKDGRIVHTETGVVPAFDHPDVQGAIVRARPLGGQPLLDDALQALVASSPLTEVLGFLATSLDHDLQGAAVAIGHGWDGAAFDHVAVSNIPRELSGAIAFDEPTPWARALAGHGLVVAADDPAWPEPVRAAAAAAGLHSCWALPVPVPPDGAELACLIVWRQPVGDPFVSHHAALERARRLVGLAFERTHSEQLLHHAANHDPLTGVANRGRFLTDLDATIGDRATRWPVALLYLDLDLFKPVNDTHGHAAGDEVLRAVTARIGAELRPGDLLARLGGDEFAVLCTGLPDADAARLADRLLATLGEPIALSTGPVVAIGASIGIAVTASPRVTPGVLLEVADAALYRAKRGGKGRWSLDPLS